MYYLKVEGCERMSTVHATQLCSLAGFLLYVIFVGAGAVVLIFYASPRWGQRCAAFRFDSRFPASRSWTRLMRRIAEPILLNFVTGCTLAMRIQRYELVLVCIVNTVQISQEPVHLHNDHRFDWLDHSTLLQDHRYESSIVEGPDQIEIHSLK